MFQLLCQHVVLAQSSHASEEMIQAGLEMLKSLHHEAIRSPIAGDYLRRMIISY